MKRELSIILFGVMFIVIVILSIGVYHLGKDCTYLESVNNYIIVDGVEYDVLHDECKSYHSADEGLWVGCYLNDTGVFVAIGEEYFISGRK